MITSDLFRRFALPFFAAFLVVTSFCGLISVPEALAQMTPTIITIGTTIQQSAVKRIGVGVGGHNFYDSQQIMNNLIFRNPGFEGQVRQVILHCLAVTSNTCTDDNLYSVWPANFLKGASAEFIYGHANGSTGTVLSSTVVATASGAGVTATFSGLAATPAVGDYVVLRMTLPGDAQGGWWTTTSGNAVFSTNLTDISTSSPGKQTLRICAPATTDRATLASYFDSTASHSFVQLNGTYTLSFRAKLVSGTTPLGVSVQRFGGASFLQTVPALTTAWQNLSYNFTASEAGALGTAAVTFSVSGGSVLLDDVSLTKATSNSNPTVFRDEFVSTLQTLKPGILRYMDSGTNWGSSIDNMLKPALARSRAGYSNYNSEVGDIPVGLHEFMVLCQTIGAEPWYSMPAGMSATEMQNLVDYLGGSTSTVYGARRAALGQTAAWTTVFPVIHLELGNEVWNTANPGATITDSVAYGKRGAVIFAAARAMPSYTAASFDLVLNGWAAVPWWSQNVLANSGSYDSIDAAPYLFNSFNDDTSNEAIFGPMFAQPEAMDSLSTGVMAQQAVVAAGAARVAKLAIYESNLSTTGGTVSQASVSAAVPSVAAGLTAVEHILLMMRDLGIKNTNMFQIGGYQNIFYNSKTGAQESTPLWGTVVDMGNTNLRRPVFLAQQLANSAILPSMLTATMTGANPTWKQATSTNDSIALTAAHYLQSFAFTDGVTTNLIVFNLNRTAALPITLAGSNAPSGSVAIQTLTSAALTDNNESSGVVAIQTSALSSVTASTTITLPPFSMTVLSSTAPSITALAVSCTPTSVALGATASCAAIVSGKGTFSTAVTWSATYGTISSAGLYTPPATLPTSGSAVITATSVADPTKSAAQTIALTLTGSITAVSVSCTAAAIQVLTTNACTATVKGTGTFASNVVWSVSVGGSISTAGLLTAPSTGATLVVTATSTQNATKSGSYTVTVSPQPVISAVLVSSLTSTSATVSWTTNTPTRNGLNSGSTKSYGTTTPYVSAFITSPSFTLTGLTPGTLYYIMPFSTINGQAAMTTLTFTTASK